VSAKTDGRDQQVISKAILWWGSKCPVSWSATQHGATPTVNTTSQVEHFLALAVADYLDLLPARPKGKKKKP
jgi:hypothetical protein